MCQRLFVGGEEIESLRDLAAMVGADRIVLAPGEPLAVEDLLSAYGDLCLCNVDLERTAERAGYRVAVDRDDEPRGVTWASAQT